MVIGLTGGIGTGKSTVSQILKDRGFTVIDLDVISHEVVKFPSVVKKIIKNFGREVLVDNEDENYIVSRKKLGKIIFADKEKRFALNSIMHPEILRVMRKKILECKSKIYSIKEQLELPLKIPKCDIFWSPHYNIPILPIRAKFRVVTIHDAFHLAFYDTLNFMQKIYADCAGWPS